MNRNARAAARILVLALAAWLLPAAAAAPARAEDAAVPLAGEWRFALDRADQGLRERWFGRALAERIKLPGILQSQGYGDEIGTQTPWVLSLYDRHWFVREEFRAYTAPGRVKVPFLSQPPRHYVGPAWYQRDIEVPAAWAGRRVVLFMERPRWESTVWINERQIGSNNSLSAPHVYDLGALAPGRHTLTVRVDSRMLMNYRPDAHSVSDSGGNSWNGVVGRIDLSSTTPVFIEDAQVFPDVRTKTALVKVTVGNSAGRAGTGTLTAAGASAPVTWDARGGRAELNVKLGPNARTWDEFNPSVHRLTLRLKGDDADDRRELTFGLTQFKTQGTHFVVNGRKTHLRGTHHGGDFPLTGYPPTDVESWRRLIRTCKEWGLNHLRFHSWAPPEAAYVAADELGFYIQSEPGMWNEISPDTPMERMLYEETERMIKAYGNHPSFVMLSASNEPKGRWKDALPKWAEHFRRADPRRLYTTGTGHTEREIPNPTEGADFLVMQRIGPKWLRGQTAWFGRDYRASLEGIDIPVASHELGQWVAYPDYDIIKKFTGYMRPGNYEIFRDSMRAKGLLDKNKDFASASGKYQLECYKEEIEANLRTPGMAGFQLLDLRDYLGQGTALVGLLDAFFEPKGYATPEQFRRFCNTTVPLARLTKRVFTNDETLDAEVEVAHYGPAPLEAASPSWRITDASGRTVARGSWPTRDIAHGNTRLGKVAADLSSLKAPGEYKLVVAVGGTGYENDWDFWLYPSRANTATPPGVLVTKSWDEAEARLAAGGKVLYTPAPAALDWTSPPLDRVPVFWNALMGPLWGRMLGTWNDTRHPALAQFPTEAHFDWQWAEIIRNVRAVNMDRLPRELRPIVYAIDDWNRNYRLGLVFEARVGRGRLLVSAFDLESARDERPVARQLRRSLLDYMASARFRPAVALAPSDIRGLMFDTRVMRRLDAKAVANSQPSNDAANAIDGDPNTYWLVGDARNKNLKHPHELVVTFPAPVSFSGLVIMPRQNHREHEGDIREYVLHASDDGASWREVTRGRLVSTFAPQTLRLPSIVTARHLRFTALDGFGPDTTAALAELAVVYEGPKLPEDTDASDLEYRRGRTASTDIDAGTDAADRPSNTNARPGRKPAPRRRRPRTKL